jgi:hypothetical protein
MQAKFKKEGFFSEINPWSNTGADIERKWVNWDNLKVL